MEVNVFVSYSHRDSGYLGKDELLGFLRGLENDSDLRFWVDEKLSGGDRWDDEIHAQLSKAHVALVLVSQSFLDSSYCSNVEIAAFLEKRRKDGLRIFPVVLSPCEWERHAWLAEHQALPGGEETIEEHYADPGKRKRLYLRIRKELRALVENIRQSQTAEPEKPGTESLAERRRVTLLQCALGIDQSEEALAPDDELELLYEAMPLFKERCTAQLQAFEGYIVDFNSSGGVVACFGYPAVYEDGGLRAVRTGIGIVEAVKSMEEEFEARLGARLLVRVGIQTGLVISSTGAAANEELQRGEVNAVATFLQEHAPPNSVVIGDATYKLVEKFFDMQPAVDREHPGIHRKIRGWRIVEDLGVRSRFDAARLQGLTPMVGREQELGMILEAWERVREGSGRMVVITAEAGVGKSRLLEEIKKASLQSAHYLIEVQCSSFHQNSALFPLAQAIGLWLQLAPEDSPELRRKKLEEAVEKTTLEKAQVVPYLADVLSIPVRPEEIPANLSAKQLKERTFEALMMLIFWRAEQTPVLFIVEDLHWMDPSTEELMGLLVDELPGFPVMAVCTTRPEYHPPTAWTERDYFLPVKLGQLSRNEVTDLVLGLTGGKILPPDVLKAIYEKTEGYPLFIEDLTKMVIESDLLYEREGVYILQRPFQSLAIPDTLQETLMARLNRVESARLVAQLGAVVGREFSHEMIQAICPLDEVALKESLGKLLASGLIYRRGVMSKANYVFKHALVQDALYQSLLKRERVRYHKKIAQLIEEKFPSLAKTEPELLAHHYKEAGFADSAVRCWIAAGEMATRNSANLEAISHANSALNALPGISDPEKRAVLELSIHTMQGPALLAVRGWAAPDLGAAFERARELSQGRASEEQIFRITRGLWGYYMVSAQLESSIQLAQELMQAGERANNDDFRIEAHAAFCDSSFWMGNPAQSAEHSERGLALYSLERHHMAHSLEFGEDPSSIFLCYGGLSNWLLGRTAKAEEIVARAKATTQSYTHLFSRGFVLNGLAWYYVHTGNPALALEYGRALEKLAKENDFPPWHALARTQCGWAIAAQGQTDEGVAEILAGMAEWRAAGALVTSSLNYALVADSYLIAGRDREALRYADEGLEHVAATEERHYHSELHRLKAVALERTSGPRGEIEEHYQQALAIAREQQAVSLEQRVCAGLARVAG